MLNPELLVKVYRRIQSRKVKALAFEALRRIGGRYLVIRMDTINLCNLRCKMCYYSSDYNRKKDEMDIDFFRKIAKEVLPRTRFLYLSCATEPLMNKNFADIVRAAGEFNVPFTSFCTNGVLLNEKVVQACLDAKLSEIIFSVDGATPETYEEIRRGAKFSRLIEKMDLLESMKRAANSEYPKVRVNFTCMANNIRELPAMVHFTADHGGRSLHVRHLLAYKDEANSCKEEMAYIRVYNSIVKETQAEAAKRGVDLFLPDPIPERVPRSMGKTCVTDGSELLEANKYCLLPWFQAVISWKGDYRICSTHTVGNLREQSFEEIYNGPRMREIRRGMFWRQKGSCSWTCREEAYDAPDQVADTEEDQLVRIGSAGD